MPGRYELHGADPTGDWPVRRHASLEVLLEDRDRRMAALAAGTKRIYFVTDGDDPERGNAEWCEICSKRGAFGVECPHCERGTLWWRVKAWFAALGRPAGSPHSGEGASHSSRRESSRSTEGRGMRW